MFLLAQFLVNYIHHSPLEEYASRMEMIELDSRTLRELSLIAKAREVTHGQAVAFLIEEFHRASSSGGTEPRSPDGVAVYATYQGHRVEGLFDARTGGLTVTSEPLAGTW